MHVNFSLIIALGGNSVACSYYTYIHVLPSCVFRSISFRASAGQQEQNQTYLDSLWTVVDAPLWSLQASSPSTLLLLLLLLAVLIMHTYVCGYFY